MSTQTAGAPSMRKRGFDAFPESAWSPLAGGLLTLIPGVIALMVGRPLLFASLGPTAYLQAAQPQQPTSRFPNVVLGHLVGFAVGALAVVLFSAADAPSAFEAKQLAPQRVLASVLAMAGVLLIAALLKPALHPPAAATTLLVTLGGFRPTWADALSVAFGVLIVAFAGEVLRRTRLAQPGQT